MAAGIATLDALRAPGVYARLGMAAETLATSLRSAAAKRGIAVQSTAIGGMWGFFFAHDRVTDFESARRADTATHARFFHAMLDRGVYLPPSAFESAFVSTAHDDALVEETEAAMGGALACCR
jgi:glutamate-1-semialdehyde 2,1-aminomutase